MKWKVAFHEDFMPEFQIYSERVQDAIFARAGLLEREGPNLARPQADQLDGSAFANMKELRFRVDDGVWRVAFAFDPESGHSVGGRRQGRPEPGTLLRQVDPNRRCTVSQPFGQVRLEDEEMTIPLQDELDRLPAERRARIEAETERLHAEYCTLRDIRRALNLTQSAVAADMGVAQATIAQLERRDDWLLSTVRRYVEAAGGRLTVTVELPDRPPVQLDLAKK